MTQLTIHHGLPKNKGFLIAQPKKDWGLKRPSDGSLEIELIDPISKQTINAKYWGCFDIEIENFTKFPQFSYLAYGKDPYELLMALLEKYPELTKPLSIIEYWSLTIA